MRRVRVGDAEIAYRVSGDEPTKRPPVVFVHGAAGSSLAWLSQLRAVSGVARALALDLPGHGHSPGGPLASIGDARTHLLGFLNALKISRATIVGHSMGGAVALDFALIHPDRVVGLALVSTSAKLGVSPAILHVIEHEWHALPRHFATVGFAPGTDADTIKRVADLLHATRPEIALADFRICNDFDLRSRLGEIASPAVVVCGDADLMTPLRHAEFLATHLKNATLVPVPGIGHMLPFEAPQVLNHALRTFVNSVANR
ncbi:MAG: alpha/beta fold hydrolase [Deltaproteobacteria bacterium]|nr:alpha/beta fold hydrolase [Deltaproteobacteria bacterium]